MTAPVKYRERQAQDGQPRVEVEVFSPSTWGGPQGYPLFHYIRYPDLTGLGIPGREYIISDELLQVHFELVLPQTLRVQAWGGVYERPMKKQRDIELQVEAGERLANEIDTDPERID